MANYAPPENKAQGLGPSNKAIGLYSRDTQNERRTLRQGGPLALQIAQEKFAREELAKRGIPVGPDGAIATYHRVSPMIAQGASPAAIRLAAERPPARPNAVGAVSTGQGGPYRNAQGVVQPGNAQPMGAYQRDPLAAAIVGGSGPGSVGRGGPGAGPGLRSIGPSSADRQAGPYTSPTGPWQRSQSGALPLTGAPAASGHAPDTSIGEKPHGITGLSGTGPAFQQELGPNVGHAGKPLAQPPGGAAPPNSRTGRAGPDALAATKAHVALGLLVSALHAPPPGGLAAYGRTGPNARGL